MPSLCHEKRATRISGMKKLKHTQPPSVNWIDTMQRSLPGPLPLNTGVYKMNAYDSEGSTCYPDLGHPISNGSPRALLVARTPQDMKSFGVAEVTTTFVHVAECGLYAVITL